MEVQLIRPVKSECHVSITTDGDDIFSTCATPRLWFGTE